MSMYLPMPRLRFELHARLPGFKRKVEQAQARVAAWLLLAKNPYIAVSSGKDSNVVLHLAREQAASIPAVYLDAQCSFPETISWLRATPHLIYFDADEPFLDTLARYGLDGGKALDRATMQSTVWGPVARLIAQYEFDGVAYGLRAQESHGRKMNAYTRGSVFQYKRDGLWACQPIWDWSYNDVWAYLVTNEIAYCRVYDRMWDMPEEDQRLSYWAGETKRRWGRYAWLKRNYPQLFNQLAARIPEVRSYV